MVYTNMMYRVIAILTISCKKFDMYDKVFKINYDNDGLPHSKGSL